MEVGGSVVIQCLFLIKMVEKHDAHVNKERRLILAYCDGDQTSYSKLSNAIASSVVVSPTPQVRSVALSLFTSLF